MLGALRKWFIPRPPTTVENTYIALVGAARNPFFFTRLGVPDTIDGRFGLIVVHLFLLQHRLVAAATTDHQEFARFLSEAFFNDMDNSLRELGVADTGVSHRIKKMGKAYHGSLQAYSAGLGDGQALRAALARNLYGTVSEGDVGALDRMAQYIETIQAALRDTDISIIVAGRYAWPDVATLAL